MDRIYPRRFSIYWKFVPSTLHAVSRWRAPCPVDTVYNRLHPERIIFLFLITIKSVWNMIKTRCKIHLERNYVTGRKREDESGKRSGGRGQADDMYTIRASWEDGQSEKTRKRKSRSASRRSGGIIIIMAGAIILSLVPTLPDVAASSRSSAREPRLSPPNIRDVYIYKFKMIILSVGVANRGHLRPFSVRSRSVIPHPAYLPRKRQRRRRRRRSTGRLCRL